MFGSHHAKNTSFHNHRHHKHSSYSRVRAVHNVAQGPNVNVVVDGNVALGNVAYKAVSDYLKVPSGQHSVAITTTDGAKTLASVNTNLSANKDYTLIAHGDVKNLGTIALLALEDNNSCPAKGKSHVRFVHAAANVPAVDIWANMANKVFSNVAYGSTGNPVYLPVASGEITLAVTAANDTNVVLGPLPLFLEAGKTYTVIASGLLDSDEAPLTALVSQDNACPTIHMGWY